MTSVNKKRNPRKNQVQKDLTMETEDGTQADRPKKKVVKKRSAVVRRAAQYGEVNEAMLKDFVKTTIETGVKNIATEFVALKMETQSCHKPKTGHETHPEKNRYKDLIYRGYIRWRNQRRVSCHPRQLGSDGWEFEMEAQRWSPVELLQAEQPIKRGTNQESVEHQWNTGRRLEAGCSEAIRALLIAISFLEVF
ncbi:unnamed protein product [Caenorhabditis nigoni]